jgi:hypothetical protein
MQRRKRLRDFKWSSYPGYSGLTKAFAFADETIVLDELVGTGSAARLRYRRFVEEGLLREIENPFHAVKWQAALGSEGFLRKIRDGVRKLHKERREITSLRKAIEFPSPAAILSKVARKFNVKPERLTSATEHGLEARNVAIWVISESCGIKLREIGEIFGGLHYSAVAQRIRRTRDSYSQKSARALIAEMSNV